MLKLPDKMPHLELVRNSVVVMLVSMGGILPLVQKWIIVLATCPKLAWFELAVQVVLDLR
jgi:hypothetical protein